MGPSRRRPTTQCTQGTQFFNCMLLNTYFTQPFSGNLSLEPSQSRNSGDHDDFGFGGGGDSPPAPPSKFNTSNTSAQNDDDDWNFGPPVSTSKPASASPFSKPKSSSSTVDWNFESAPKFAQAKPPPPPPEASSSDDWNFDTAPKSAPLQPPSRPPPNNDDNWDFSGGPTSSAPFNPAPPHVPAQGRFHSAPQAVPSNDWSAPSDPRQQRQGFRPRPPPQSSYYGRPDDPRGGNGGFRGGGGRPPRPSFGTGANASEMSGSSWRPGPPPQYPQQHHYSWSPPRKDTDDRTFLKMATDNTYVPPPPPPLSQPQQPDQFFPQHPKPQPPLQGRSPPQTQSNDDWNFIKIVTDPAPNPHVRKY